MVSSLKQEGIIFLFIDLTLGIRQLKVLPDET